MKKMLIVFMAAAMIVVQLAACGGSAEEPTVTPTENVQESTEPSGTNSGEVKLDLYFTGTNAEKLQIEERTVVLPFEAGVPSYDVLAKSIIEQTASGPTISGLGASIPEGTELNSVTLAGGILSIDFNSVFETDNPGGSTGIFMAFGAVVLGLSQIDGVDSIKITVDGVGGDFKGHLTLDEPFIADDFIDMVQ